MNAERRTPNAERRTPNAERRTPNAERRTPNAERRTPNAERRTPNAERRTPNAERRTPNAERRTPNALGRVMSTRRQEGPRPDPRAGRYRTHFSLLPRLALLLGALSLFVALPAQAQFPVWSATLTVGQGSGFFGCNQGWANQANKCAGALSSRQFTYGGATYLVESLQWAPNELFLRVKRNGSTVTANTIKSRLAPLTLNVNGAVLAISDGVQSSNTFLKWAYDPATDWTVGQRVSLSLGPPFGVSMTPACGTTVSNLSTQPSFVLGVIEAPAMEVGTEYRVLTAAGPINRWLDGTKIRTSGLSYPVTFSSFAELFQGYPGFTGFEFRRGTDTVSCTWEFSNPPRVAQDPRDRPYVSLTLENAGSQGEKAIVVKLSKALPRDVTIPLTINNTTAGFGFAVLDADYMPHLNPSNWQYTIPAGETELDENQRPQLVRSAADNHVSGPPGVVIVSLDRDNLPSSVRLGGPPSGRWVLDRDDRRRSKLTADITPNPVPEGGTVNVTAVIRPRAVDVTIPMRVQRGQRHGSFHGTGEHDDLAKDSFSEVNKDTLSSWFEFSVTIPASYCCATHTIKTNQDYDTDDETFNVMVDNVNVSAAAKREFYPHTLAILGRLTISDTGRHGPPPTALSAPDDDVIENPNSQSQQFGSPQTESSDLITRMWGWRNDPQWVSYKSHTDRWDRALLALGETVSDPSLPPMTAAEAQAFADSGMTRWVDVASALVAKEARDGITLPDSLDLGTPIEDEGLLIEGERLVPSALHASLITDMYGWRNDPQWVSHKSHTDRWDRALLALGEPVSDTTLTPMTDSEAQGFADTPWGERWVPVAAAFKSVVTGTSSADTLQGTSSDELLVGLGGADTLNGLGGSDELRGGAGGDTHTGGAGADRFVFFSTQTGANVITDFESGDVIVLEGNGWPSVADIIASVQSVGSGNYRYTLASGLTVETTNNRSLRTEDFVFE